MSNKLRVLIIAEAANPEWTSVPLLGWSHSVALSKVCDVHLATQVRNKAAIERFGWIDGKQFTAINSEKLAAPLEKFSRILRGSDSLSWTTATAIQSLVYPYFEYLVWQTFKADLIAGNFDIVHRITPVSPTAPSYLAKKLAAINVPYVVGPQNGGVAWPPHFGDLQRKEKEWLSYFRGAYKWMPGLGALQRHAACLIGGSLATRDQYPRKYADKILYLPENAIDPARFSLQNHSGYELPIKAAFVGRLVPYKGADMAIEAMEELVREGKMTFDIYGNGPEEARLNQLVQEKGLNGKVIVHGFVPNSQLQSKLVTADLFVFPSVREFGGGVVLEAMALGVVPLIADYAGPAELVTDASGYRVKMGTRSELIANFRTQLNQICAAPEQLTAKRQACLDRIAKYFTWEKKAQQMIQVYEWLLGHAAKPDFASEFIDRS